MIAAVIPFSPKYPVSSRTFHLHMVDRPSLKQCMRSFSAPFMADAIS